MRAGHVFPEARHERRRVSAADELFQTDWLLCVATLSCHALQVHIPRVRQARVWQQVLYHRGGQDDGRQGLVIDRRQRAVQGVLPAVHAERQAGEDAEQAAVVGSEEVRLPRVRQARARQLLLPDRAGQDRGGSGLEFPRGLCPLQGVLRAVQDERHPGEAGAPCSILGR